jgi:hypothetical protein
MYGPRPGRNSLLDRPIDVVSHSHEIDFGSTQLLAESEIMSRATKQIWQDISIYIYIPFDDSAHVCTAGVRTYTYHTTTTNSEIKETLFTNNASDCLTMQQE